jgi:hypothetical protein
MIFAASEMTVARKTKTQLEGWWGKGGRAGAINEQIPDFGPGTVEKCEKM